MPFLAVYSGTKTYNKKFSEIINFHNWTSHTAKHVDTLVVKPGSVSTAMNNFKKGYDVVTPEAVSKGTFTELGIHHYTNGGLRHAATSTFLGLTPNPLIHLFKKYDGI